MAVVVTSTCTRSRDKQGRKPGMAIHITRSRKENDHLPFRPRFPNPYLYRPHLRLGPIRLDKLDIDEREPPLQRNLKVSSASYISDRSSCQRHLFFYCLMGALHFFKSQCVVNTLFRKSGRTLVALYYGTSYENMWASCFACRLFVHHWT